MVNGEGWNGKWKKWRSLKAGMGNGCLSNNLASMSGKRVENRQGYTLVLV